MSSIVKKIHNHLFYYNKLQFSFDSIYKMKDQHRHYHIIENLLFL